MIYLCACGCGEELKTKRSNQRFKDSFHRWKYYAQRKTIAVKVLEHLEKVNTLQGNSITLTRALREAFEVIGRGASNDEK